ncbi:hypothetical protein TRFO_36447 [Tritrichomonas foetus]|uniref:Raptor N-terminal CASPase-like domain-containing protein n=1 Tax=Tritrichomonas foetus TaxID=1144522 RepID=A0A1J4JE19_9EUKA|nr:hypothetical protein TRFO_36447 [Tritrichomonas foetus]|eukprot:OHS97352.1 hypothetical protein TRFO_36447 [Tritrichomonas foetus]
MNIPTNQSGRRTTRAPIVFSRPQGGVGNPPLPPKQQQNVSKTKFALCFLCLFDGLRTPSIRRLVRKARTICQQPLVTFDPSCFAPSSITALQETYKETLNCQCEITVDPSVQTVLQQLRRSGTSMPPQRLLIHYYGQGSHIPDDGTLYFFSEDHSRYKPLKISSILANCSCPLSMIFECSKSAILLKHLQDHPDLFAFFSCDVDEFLPLSTDAEMDLFSSCLLSPFQVALKWHMRRHNKIYADPLMPTDESLLFLKQFFHAVLSAIFYDSQKYEIYQKYTRDPSVASLARGFVLAQRVMLSYNIHPVALPALESMENHPLWSFWDTALDCGITMELDECSTMIFNLFVDSFNRYPHQQYYPIFSFFLRTQNFHVQTAKILLDYLDHNKNAAELAAMSSLPNSIAELDRPSPLALVALAKMIVAGKRTPFDQNSAITFTASKDSEILKAGILTLCCTIATSSLASFSRLTQLCIDHASDCAPFSSLLLGNLIEQAGRLMNLPFFGLKFVPLLNNERVDIRASAAFLLGFSKDKNEIEPLMEKLEDESYIVRFQAALSILELQLMHPDKKSLEKVKGFLYDKEIVPEDAETIKSLISTLNQQSEYNIEQEKNSKTKLFRLLIEAVRNDNFQEKYNVNVFDVSDT